MTTLYLIRHSKPLKVNNNSNKDSLQIQNEKSSLSVEGENIAREKMNNMELRKLLMNLGIYSNLEGYHFVLAALEILSKQKIHTNVTTVYQMIGKDIEKNPSAIERGIRHTILKCWKKRITK